MKKKLVSMFLTVTLVVSMLTGCGTTAATETGADTDSKDTTESVSAETDNSDTETDAADKASNSEKQNIGVILYGKDDTMGAAVYSYLNYAAEAIGCDITWAFGDYDAASQLTTCQNMVAAGCKGILMMPMDASAVQQVSTYCEQNSVYFGIMFRDITDEGIKAQVEAMEYYVVDGFEDDEKYAKRMIEYMTEEYGVSNFGLEILSAASPLASRNAGFEAGLAATGATKLAEFTYPSDCNTQQVATGVENFINSYPNMDAIALGNASVGAGETCINTLESMTEAGAVKVGCFDAFEGMKTAFEKGYLVYACGGMGVEALFDFIVLYNAVDGTPLSDTFTVLNLEEIEVKSAEDCEAYEKYIDNPDYQIYDAETIKSMVKRFNPDASIDNVKQYMSDYSLEWVVSNAK